MNDKLETNKKYEILDGDDDVLLLGRATFTVGRFKQLASSKFNQIMVNDNTNNNNYYLQNEPARGKSIIQWMQSLLINEETQIMGGDISWKSPPEGIDCQIL